MKASDAVRVAVVLASVFAAIASSDSKSGGSASGTPAATPPPQTTTASWDTGIGKLSTADKETGRAAARQLVGFCGSHDPHGDTWSRVQRIDVEHHSIFTGGQDVMIWELSAKFPDDWKFDVLRGNTLWYRLDDARTRIFPMKTVSGDVCGVPAEQWSKL